MATALEYQVRDARLTDIDRISELIQRSDPAWTNERTHTAAELLRQLVYMPSASVVVAVDGRQIEGVAILSLRPSVTAGGFVGTIDLLAVEPGLASGGPLEALLNELARSARNKGCVVVETVLPAEPAVLAALERKGFHPASSRLSLSLSAVRAGVG
jgi:N-acetylglutamate synthase-like GNAT family acetyltransferase